MIILKKIKNNLQYKIFVSSCSLILFTVVVISIFSYNKSNKTIEKNLGEYTYQIVTQVNSNIEFYVKDMEALSNMCNYNYNIQKYLKNYRPANDLERYTDANKITELINNTINFRRDIVSVFLFGNNGYVLRIKPEQKLVDNFNIYDYSWYTDATTHYRQAVLSSPHIQNYVKNSNKTVVSLSRVITNYDSSESVGVILIDLNTNVIKDICSKIKLGQEGYVCVFDQKGNVIYHPDTNSPNNNFDRTYINDILNKDSGSFIKVIDNKKKLITYTTSKYTNWKIIGVASVDEMITGSKETRNYIIVIGILSTIILFFIAAYISSKITDKLKKLELKMKKVENGNLDVLDDINTEDEIGRLNLCFNKMIRQIKELMNQIVREHQEIRKTEMKLLQSQINPHFLYNTLDSIVWMAESNKKEDVIEMTLALARLFRISLSKGKEAITVQEEIEHVKSYLIIQKMRYKSKLDFVFEIQPDTLKLYTLKLILQPLVENSIYHGIKNKREKGVIKITAHIEENNLIFNVIDNGIGMSEDKIYEILNYNNNTSYNGVAIKNIKDRIKLYFGDDYSISYSSILNEGTCVKVNLPIIKEWDVEKPNEEKVSD